MASNYFHARSISLTSSTHPLIQSLEEELSKFESQESSSFSLLGLKDLYDRVEEALQVSLVQRALSRSDEAVLDASLNLLDACGTALEALAQLKHCLRDLASSLRRKKGPDPGLAREIAAYARCRKKINERVMSKCLAKLKKIDAVDEEGCLVRGAGRMVARVLESVLWSVSEVPRWSVVWRLTLVRSKRGSVMERLDGELRKCGKDGNVVRVRKMVEEVESGVREMEEELECVYRRMVQTRVALLNIFNN